jgi:hypothetical protein
VRTFSTLQIALSQINELAYRGSTASSNAVEAPSDGVSIG